MDSYYQVRTVTKYCYYQLCSIYHFSACICQQVTKWNILAALFNKWHIHCEICSINLFFVTDVKYQSVSCRTINPPCLVAHTWLILMNQWLTGATCYPMFRYWEWILLEVLVGGVCWPITPMHIFPFLPWTTPWTDHDCCINYAPSLTYKSHRATTIVSILCHHWLMIFVAKWLLYQPCAIIDLL